MMPIPPSRAPGGHAGVAFPRALRFELGDEEGRALLSSYGIALTLALAWLIAVRLTPLAAEPSIDFRELEQPIILVADPGPVVLPKLAPVVAPTPRPTSGAPSVAADPGGAFAGAGAPEADASHLLRGLVMARDAGGLTDAGVAGKVVLSAGTGDARTPGYTRIGGTGGVGDGRVGTGGGPLAHARARVATLPVVAPAMDGGDGRSAGELGMAVRARAAQVQSCYTREGLVRAADLAGTITIALTIDLAGRVSDARIARRSWSGPGAAETELCIVALARGWTFARGDATGRYEFGFSFSTGR